MYKENREEAKIVTEVSENDLRYLPMNLQLFASNSSDDDNDDNDDNNDGDNNNDNDDDNNADNNNDDKDKKDNSGSTSGSKSKTKGRTFTQEEVNRMMAREKRQGRTAALKELGINPKDTKAIEAAKAIIDSQKTDEQKEAEKRSEEQEKIAEAEYRAMVAEAKAEAMQLGVKAQYVDDIVALVLAKKSDDNDIKTLIGEYKIKYPVWFGMSEDDDDNKDKNKTGQKGTGSSVKPSRNKDGDKGTKGLGARLAAQRKTANKKSSYWTN